MQETEESQFWSQGREDPSEEGMATHSSILNWRMPPHRQRSLEGCSPWGCKESDMTEVTRLLSDCNSCLCADMEATRWWQYGQPSSPGRPHAVMLGWVSFGREKVNLRKLLWEKKFGDKIERSKQGAWASLVAQMVKNLPAMQEMWVWSLGGEDSPGKRDDNPLQHSCLENPMDRGAWWAIVLRITKSQTRLRATITHTHTKKRIKNLSPYHR